MARRIAGTTALVVVCLTGLLAGPVPSAAAASSATIDVHATASLGALNNASWNVNHSRTAFLQPPNEGGPLSSNVVAQLQNQFDLKVTRVFVDVREYYNASTGQYNFPVNYSYLDEAASFADRLLICFTPLIGASPALYEQVVRDGLRDYKQRHPKIEYVETWNEPNHVSGGPLTAAQYYEHYKASYKAVNTVNAELNPAVRLKVGGPVSAGFNVDYITDFLDLYKADSNSAKKLDFVAYHDYSFRGSPKRAYDQKSRVSTWLGDKGLDPATPVYVTEYGLYAGLESGQMNGSTAAQDLAHDQLVQAAGMAATGRYYMLGDMDLAFQWVISHATNDRKDMFFDGTGGIRTPYGHMVAMQAMLKSTRMTTTISEGASSEGVGLSAIATSDSSGVAVMYWNYQGEGGSTTYNAQITVHHLPSSFQGKKIRIQRYLVDSTHSNYNYSTAQTGLQLVEDITVTASQVTRTPGLGKNAVGLMVLTPVD